ncbi:MAG: DUF1206 domain-containing protein [Nocardioides sp.]
MTNLPDKVGSLGQQAHNSEWLERVARVGLVAYGVVHVVIGILAVRLAFGDGSGAPSSSGAMQELAQQPFGKFLVWAVAVGMFLLALWQGLEGALGHRDEDGADQVRKKVTSIGKAVVYVVIGISAVKVAVGSGSSGGTDSTTAKIMDLPAGQLLVGVVGLVIVGIGGFFLYSALTERYMKKVDGKGSSGDSGKAYKYLGKAGYAAKGVAFFIVGGLFGYAAVTHESEKSGGIDVALREVLDQPFGPVLLTLMGLGFAAYGLFCFVRARHFDG